ncbi:pyridine nucleotide transhydrogenase [bacterium]|nr:pyridine nucleotide transhydrogenase [bacterium]
MKSALVGHTGFVGGHLAAQHSFDEFYNSKNVEEIAGRSFDLIAVSAMPAAMWIANQDPEGDRRVLDRLLNSLRQAKTNRVVLISTVAVYPKPIGIDEDSPIDPSKQTAYGRHRHQLELELAAHFKNVLAVRLPGLFGKGLKKNAVYDLIHHNELEKVNAASVYQFYNLDHLWGDISIATSAGLSVINFSAAPTSIREVAQHAFGIDFHNDPGTPAANYDMRSKHAELFGGKDGYLYSKEQVLADLKSFVANEKGSVETK